MSTRQTDDFLTYARQGTVVHHVSVGKTFGSISGIGIPLRLVTAVAVREHERKTSIDSKSSLYRQCRNTVTMCTGVTTCKPASPVVHLLTT